MPEGDSADLTPLAYLDDHRVRLLGRRTDRLLLLAPQAPTPEAP